MIMTMASTHTSRSASGMSSWLNSGLDCMWAFLNRALLDLDLGWMRVWVREVGAGAADGVAADERMMENDGGEIQMEWETVVEVEVEKMKSRLENSSVGWYPSALPYPLEFASNSWR